MTKLRSNQTQIEEILNDPLAFASELKKGSVRIATQSEVDLGIDTLAVVSPNTLANFQGINYNWLSANSGLDFATAPVASGTNAIAIGNLAISDASDSIAIGSRSDVNTGIQSIVMGYRAFAGTADKDISIGAYSQAYGGNSISIGSGALTGTGDNSAIALGPSTNSFDVRTISIGSAARAGAGAPDGIAIGSSAYTNKSSQINIGNLVRGTSGGTTSTAYSVKIGYDGTTTASKHLIKLFDAGHFGLYGAKAQFEIPPYTTGNEPAAPTQGSLIYNATINALSTYNGSAWNVVGGIANIVEDLTPQLGGDLDTNNFNIVGVSGSTTQPATIDIIGGATAAGNNGGDINLVGGVAPNGYFGGNVILTPGTGAAGPAYSGNTQVVGDFVVHDGGSPIVSYTVNVDSTNNRVALNGLPSESTGTLQVTGDLDIEGGVRYRKPDNTVPLSTYRGGTNFFVVRDFADVYTVQQIWSAPGAINVGSPPIEREATLALVRGDEPNQEFMDIYNNGYNSETQFGLRLQKRGTGIFRDFVIDYDDGTTKTEVLRIKPDQSAAFGGAVTSAATPTTIDALTRKDYVDASSALKVNRSGDTMTGSLVMGDGTAAANIAVRNATGYSSLAFRKQDNTNAAGLYYTDTAPDQVSIWTFNAAGDALLNNTGFLPDGNVNIVGTAPTAPSHLTRKDYVDTAISTGDALKVNKAGDTMTGNLTIGDGTTGDSITVRANTGNAHVWYRRSDNSAFGVCFANIAGDNLKINKYAADGTTVETWFSVNNNGNVSVSGAAPTGAADLTRKDYVDNTTVSLTGDTMTGNLNVVTTGIDAVITARRTDAGVAYVALRDSSNILRSALLLTNTGATYWDQRDAAGATTTRLQMGGNGQVTMTVGAAAPTGAADLTRKDYVDNNFVSLATSQTITGEKTFAAQFTNFSHGGGILSFDNQTAPDGRGIRRITNNDGFGNWNFRTGVYANAGAIESVQAGDGGASIVLGSDAAPGSIQLQTANGVSTAAGDAMPLRSNISVTYNSVIFSSAMSQLRWAKDPAAADDLTRKSYVDANDRLTINAQTGQTYTLVLTDENALVTMNNATANTLTIPDNATVPFPIGAQILVEQEGAVQVLITSAGVPTIHSAGNLYNTASQYTTISLIKKATDTWLIVGDLV